MMNIGEIATRNARRHPKKLAIVENDYRCNFLEFNNRVNRLANSLSSLGVEKGDRVAIVLKNCHEYVEILFAAAKIGAITVPINFRLKEKEIRYQLTNSGSRVLFFGSEHLEIAKNLRDGSDIKIEPNVSVRCFDNEMTGYEDLLSPGTSTEPQTKVEDEDIISIMYTSGTTGVPKGAVWTHKNILDTILNLIVAHGTNSEDKSLLIAPLFHGAITVPMLHQFFFLGATVVLYHKDSFEADDVFEIIEREKITATFMVPTMVEMIIDNPNVKNYDLNSLKNCKYAGAAIHTNTLLKAIKVFGPIFDHGYGITETTGGVTVLRKEEHRIEEGNDQERIIWSAGKEYINVHVRIVDKDGCDVQPGDTGEIIVRGDKVFRGYWKLPTETEKVLKDGWYFTGDLGKLNAEGYLYIVGRKKDMIISGGENIYPAEIEEAIISHPAVKDVSVIGIPNRKWGEEVCAVVVLSENTKSSEDEIIKYCEERLASYKKPKSVHFVDSLPINTMGKVDKSLLKKLFSRLTAN